MNDRWVSSSQWIDLGSNGGYQIIICSRILAPSLSQHQPSRLFIDTAIHMVINLALALVLTSNQEYGCAHNS